jgi:Domain of unknown function (DUF5668)
MPEAKAPRSRSALAFGAFFVLAGVMFLADRLGIWDVRVRYLAPLLLIALGLAILLGGRFAGEPK